MLCSGAFPPRGAMQRRKSARLKAKAANKQLERDQESSPADEVHPDTSRDDHQHCNRANGSGDEEDIEFSLTELTSLASDTLLNTLQLQSGGKSVGSSSKGVTEIPPNDHTMSESFISLASAKTTPRPITKTKKRRATDLPPGLQPNLTGTGPLVFEGLDSGKDHTGIWNQDEELMKKSVLTSDFEQKPGAPIELSKFQKAKLRKLEKEKSAGSGWFHLPATPLTPELRNDLKLLKMRGAIDPKQHYKRNDSKELSKYFQVGRVIGGPAEFYSSRIPKKQQKNTIVEELLADDKFRKYHKRKYAELRVNFSKKRRLKKLPKKGKFKK